MQCPKCGHTQENTYECESCGIIFSRYEEKLRKEQAEKYEHKDNSPAKKSGFKWLLFPVILIPVLVYFMIPGESQQTESVHTSAMSESHDTIPAENQAPETNNKVDTNSISRMLAAEFKPRNTLEKSTLATVFIRTSWGLGSGFFINDKCKIVTNKHVIEFDRNKVQKAEQIADFVRKSIESQKAQLEELNSRIYMAQSEAEKRMLKRRYEAMEQNIARNEDGLKNLEGQIDNVGYSRTSSIKVILKNGDEYSAVSSDKSPDSDLAVLEIVGHDCPYLPVDQQANLPLGEKVFTIGNPSGLKHTVTSGIVSGYQDIGDRNYIQTDAPINPGNSGGPLIDEQGRVVGINTMILSRTEGIGFAIPIKAVFTDFPLLRK